jgi:DNA topoisomerase-1
MGATEAHAGLTRPDVTPRPASASNSADRSKAKRKSTAAKGGRAGSRSRTAAKSAASRRTTSKTQGKATREAKSNGSVPRGTKLVIVESPAKARSIGSYLGKEYTVKASKGHVRDLLVSQLSVDVENDFEPKYRVPNEKREIVKELKQAAQAASEVILATDPDREGEAIAWHLIAATEIENRPVKRVIFHEITKSSIQDAFDHPRAVDLDLVNAQQARRILDRLVGYPVSELLWQKVRNGLSAGRVQSIAMRLIVDREREIEAFVPVEYWTLDAELNKPQGSSEARRPFLARLVKIRDEDVQFGSEGDVTPHLAVLERAIYTVSDVRRGERQRKPSAPFTTSTLQQEASRRLNFSASRTMSVAQQLYEGIELSGGEAAGLITYMRTDSTHVSVQAQQETRAYVQERFGAAYLPASAPVYKTRAKGAQEAHEAIRPTSVQRTPEAVKYALTSEQYKLYNLIWQRFVASQMAPAIYNTLRVEIGAGDGDQQPYLFRVSGSTIKFVGFLVLYEDTRDEDLALDADEGRILPEFTVGEVLHLRRLIPEQHFTQPPPRYTEATLVRTLEENGIGRPSTYAQTLKVIQERDYIDKKDKRLYPTETGKLVTDVLVRYFPEVMDVQFTARMEDQLDRIAEGKLDWRPMLHRFYTPFEHNLQTARQTMPSLQREEAVGRDCPVCGNPLLYKYGRFGKFIGCSNYPDCRHTEPLVEKLGIACPQCGEQHGGEIVVKRSRAGRTFYGCARYPACDFTSWKKPLVRPCPNCSGLLVEQNRTSAQCLQCGNTYALAMVQDTTADAEPA